jgi:predicted RNase H-like HicB family nuclease
MDYIAYLHKDRKSDFGVSFPDFPGCVTAGKSLDEARRRAPDALAFHIAGMMEDGRRQTKCRSVSSRRRLPKIKNRSRQRHRPRKSD